VDQQLAWVVGLYPSSKTHYLLFQVFIASIDVLDESECCRAMSLHSERRYNCVFLTSPVF